MARYTLADGRRPTLAMEQDWMEAWRKACAYQDTVDTIGYADPSGRLVKFPELVEKYWRPSKLLSDKTWMTKTSFLGDGTGLPKRKGRKDEIAAKHALLYYFRKHAVGEIDRPTIEAWTTSLLKHGLEPSSVRNKLSLLRDIMRIAVEKDWLPRNPCEGIKIKNGTPKEKRVFTYEELAWTFGRLEARGPGCLLWAKLSLEVAARYQDMAGARPMDLEGPKFVRGKWEPAYLHMRQAVSWVSREKNTVTPGSPWQLVDDKGKKGEKVALTTELYEELLDYIETNKRADEALIFDDYALRREVALYNEARQDRPRAMSKEDYVNPETGRFGGPHGTSRCRNAGCRCPFCKNAYALDRKMSARAKGRVAAQPWLEAIDLDARSHEVDPVDYGWFSRYVWGACVKEAIGGAWVPKLHSLRHTSLTWSRWEGVDAAVLQRDARHSSMRTTEGYLADKKPGDERLPALKAMKARMSGDVPEQSAPPMPVPTGPTNPLDIGIMAMLAAMTDEEKAQAMVTLASRPRPALRAVE